MSIFAHLFFQKVCISQEDGEDIRRFKNWIENEAVCKTFIAHHANQRNDLHKSYICMCLICTVITDGVILPV